MKKTILISTIIILKCLILSAQSDWKLSSEKEGIKIYTSNIPESKIKAIKVECEFSATASQLVAVLLDVKAAPEWVYHTKSCVLIKQVSASELYYYSEINLPWPAHNRDFIAHLTVSQNPYNGVITVDGPAVPEIVPVKEKTVRIYHSVGKWIITPLGYDRVKVAYTLHVDPGGTLPSWLVNMFATEGPQQIFKSLKLQLLKSAYRNVSLAFINDGQNAAVTWYQNK